MQAFYGKYRAVVVDINDPEQLGRIRVKCPKVLRDMRSSWACSCFPPGIFDMPDVGDTVWIEFEDGDVDKPIWTGIFATKTYMQKLLSGITYSPNTKVWRMSADEKLLLYVDGKGLLKLAPTGSVVKTSGVYFDINPTNSISSLL